MIKKIKFSILGCGSRGVDTYGKYMVSNPKKFKLVSVCDHTQAHLDKAVRVLGKCKTFLSEDEFLSKRRGDLLVLTSMDKDHYSHCKKALELGYDILLEKPISSNVEELNELRELQRKYHNKVLVCYVLKYSPLFNAAKELLDSGVIGALSSIQALEQARYDMFVHSYVRGRWADMSKTSPIILAKSSHDLDLIQWFVSSKAVNVQSSGRLNCFTPDKAPADSAERCLECKYCDECIYSAKKLYIDNWYTAGHPEDEYPYNTVDTAPINLTKIYDALNNKNYGKCVYKCDSNAYDSQSTIITFENGVIASFTMTGVSGAGGRVIKLYGSIGEIDIDEEHEKLILKKYGEKEQIIDYKVKNESGLGYEHSLSDYNTVDALYDYLTAGEECKTSLAESLKSHFIGIEAFKSCMKKENKDDKNN